MRALVLDSSALITLAGAEALPLLDLSGNVLATIPEVYQETVEVGGQLGRSDAAAIAEWFERSGPAIRDPHRPEKVGGVSSTDSRLLLLAEELDESRLLTNDHTLIRKALDRGLAAWFSAELIHRLWELGKISRDQRQELLGCFVARGRYSERFLQALFLRRD